MLKSKDELLADYPDRAMREKILLLASLSNILTECIIPNNYRVPARLHEPLKLTAYGEEKVQQFIRKRIPYPEARLMCLLSFSWVDLLIDPVETNLTDLREAISDEIKRQEVIFPFIFGRLLYDKAFDTLNISDGTYSLNLVDTFSLLTDTPQGVSQENIFITGPYGILESRQWRYYPPSRQVSLYHCSDLSCSAIHSIDLATGREASINKRRSDASKILRAESETPSAWPSFLSQVFDEIINPDRDNAADGLIPLIGDAFTEAEIRALTCWLLDNTRGALRETFAHLGMRGRAEDMTQDLSRAQMMQLCLTLEDRMIIQGLDGVIRENAIQVPRGEIRRAKVNGGSRFGKLHLAAEVGHRGARIFSDAMNMAPLRLRHLVERMYRVDSVDDREELDWQLRSETGETLEARLDSYLNRHSPEEAAKTLILARKSNAVTACEVLGLPDNFPEDPNLISAVLWKLGFPSPDLSDPHFDFWRLHEEMEEMVRAGVTGPLPPSAEDFRGIAANYFVQLENMLDDSLSFTVWALTKDHFADRKSFVYSPEEARRESYSWLQSAVEASGDSVLEYGNKNSLYALCRGFGRLSTELKRISKGRQSWERPAEEFPDWSDRQDLLKFPFRHTIPFLDLTDASREIIVNRLQETSRILVGNNISDARNSWMHGGRSTADFDEVRSSLNAIRQAVQIIEDCGFVRMNFSVVSRQIDAYSRSITRFTRPRGYSFELHKPSPYDWLGLPTFKTPIHVMTAACFSAPNHFLRFRSEIRSTYSEMWANYPRRKPRAQLGSRAITEVSAQWKTMSGNGEETISPA
ncbi:hypothetical protein [Streptomyces sp. WAC08401]|uniref:hypothetical protein n=1 Tax=Streptomyces sp. WAC08401 TaxID=2487413 RepID=UPI000FABAB75|nr:hypothetical protein [Streptomyces sp. WAC08401]RSS09990.1 hypothetical protein EF915_30305 [Streptomyces sp. WAC08401]